MIPAVMVKSSVFFIDDEDDFIHDLIGFLPKSHNMEIFTNPLEALTELAKRPEPYIDETGLVFQPPNMGTVPSVMIIDHRMAPIDGIELCKRARGNRAKRVMLTSYATKDEAIDALNRKLIDAFLLKTVPTLPDDLAKVIAQCTTEYFLDLSKEISGYKRQGNPLLNPCFSAFFEEFCRRHCVVEHSYFHDFHCLKLNDNQGQERFVTIYDEEQLEDLINSDQALSADARVLELLKQRSSALCLRNINSPQLPDGARWGELLVPLLPIGDGLFVATS